jgi:hypothetical protein
VITVSIDGSTPITHTVTAAEAAAPATPISVLLPATDITAAGQGPATITTTYADAAGNPATGTPLTTNLTIDTQVPTTPTVDALSTNDTTPVITGTVTLLSGETLTVTVNGATYNNVTVDGTGHWSIDTATAPVSSGILGAFVDGQSYEVVATAKDAANNTASDITANELHIDTTALAPSLALAHDLGGSSTDLLTSDGTINVTGLEVGATWQYSLDGGTSWQPGNGGAATTTTTGSFVANAGSYGAGSVVVKQTDAAGNTSVDGELVSTTTVAQRTLHVLTGETNDSAQITGLSDGGYVVFWKAMTDAGVTQCFTQRYDSANSVVGSPVALAASADSDSLSLVITATVNGGYVAAWRSNNGTDTDVRIQYVDQYNTAGPSVLIGGATTLGYPKIAALDNAGVFTGVAVVYESSGNGSLLEAYDANGTQVLSPVQVTDQQSTGGNDNLSLTALANGGYVIASVKGINQNCYIHLEQYDSNHQQVSTTDFPTLQRHHPDITAMPDGGYVVTYAEYYYFSSANLFFQRFDAAGNALTGIQTVAGPAGLNHDPVVTALGNGDYVLAWSASTSDGNGYDVFVQRFDGASNLAAGPMSQLHGEAGNYGDGGDNNVKLVALTGGGYVVTWYGFTATQDSEIFFQQYDATGATTGGVQHLQGWANGDADYPSALTALSDGGFAISWTGHDGAASEILTQRFDASGNLVPETLALTVDNTAPTLQSSSPADEGAVGADANISLTFSENMALGSSGHILLKNLSGGADIDIDLANPAGQLSVVDNKLVINPSADLTVGHSYAVHVDAGAVTDAAGNAFAGIANDTTLNFVAGLPSELHLGTVSGIDLNLIGGFTTSGGQRYYYLDLSNDGSAMDAFTDGVDHNALDALFNGGADTVDTQPGGAVAGVDDARTVLVGGYTLVLPTEAELTTALPQIPNGSDKWSFWDGYWSATQTAADEHAYIMHPMGYMSTDQDVNSYVVALQVL